MIAATTERTSYLKGHSVGEVAEALGVCAPTIYREIRSGNMKCLHIGRKIVITDDQLNAYLTSKEA